MDGRQMARTGKKKNSQREMRPSGCVFTRSVGKHGQLIEVNDRQQGTGEGGGGGGGEKKRERKGCCILVKHESELNVEKGIGIQECRLIHPHPLCSLNGRVRSVLRGG